MPENVIEVQVGEDGDQTVEVDPTEHGFVPESELDSRFQNRFEEELSKRVAKATKGMVDLDDLAADEDRLEELRERRPDIFKSDDDGRPEEEVLGEHRKAWEAKHLKPVQKKAESLEEKAETLEGRARKGKILEAMDSSGVVEDQGQRELIRAYYAGRTEYDVEEDVAFVLDEETGERIPSGDGETPYLTVSEDLRRKREEDGFQSWFKGKSRGGGGYEGPGEGEGGDWGHIKARSDLKSRSEKIKFVNERGLEAFEKLPAVRPDEE